MSLHAGSIDLHQYIDNLRMLSFPIGIYRPPSEGGRASLLLRTTENCPWNKCTFCAMYKEQPFICRSVEAIKADIDAVAAIRDEIIAVSWKLGFAGEITRQVGEAIIRADYCHNLNHSFYIVFHWLWSGGKTAFLQDADSLIMRSSDMETVLSYLLTRLPSLSRVTTYARSKTLVKKRLEELHRIQKAGLNRLHIGLETGDDELLAIVQKGVTSAEQIDGGQKAMAAGFQVSEYWMPDLGGRERWLQHSTNTARVLSAINPHYIRSRPLVPKIGTPIFEDYKAGRLILSSPHERLNELECMVEKLDVTSRVCFDHARNSWVDGRGEVLFRHDYEGYKFPTEKPLLLDRIREGINVAESRHVHVRELIRMESL